MNEMSNSVYQSGQKVEIAGYYEMVGNNSRVSTLGTLRSVQALQVEDLFPNYDGRAVCWYLVSRINVVANSKPPVQRLPNCIVESQAGLTG
jgi:hypothetical protein